MPLSPDIQASDIVFALVKIDQELWDGWIAFQKNQQVRRWKEPKVYEWSYNGRPYSCEPGQTVQIPLLAAQHGVKTSGVFRLDTDDAGKQLASLDHKGGQEPLVVILKTMTAGEPGMEMKPLPVSAPILCPFGCKNLEFVDQEALKGHLVAKHQIVATQSKAQQAMAAATSKSAA